ncbi:MAG: spermidine synthase [Candidatus Sericytochromatia bacterium]
MPTHCLFEHHDTQGSLYVWDDGIRRTLGFGPDDIQSVCLKADPACLQLDYTQAMLLGLLFAHNRRILCLGLGAGSLVTALHTHSKRSEITAVELSSAVISVAQRYFYLPQGKRIQLHAGDAAAFMASRPGRYDLIFSDLYTAAGVVPVQLQADFLADCAACLKATGVLVINGWRSEDTPLLAALTQTFRERASCRVPAGNRIFLASQHSLTRPAAALKTDARQWSQQLGFDLQTPLRHLQPL